jgi:hypothetical protein
MLKEAHRYVVFEKRVLQRIFGSGRVEVTGVWRKMYSGELPKHYLLQDTMRMIKSRKMRLTEM